MASLMQTTTQLNQALNSRDHAKVTELSGQVYDLALTLEQNEEYPLLDWISIKRLPEDTPWPIGVIIRTADADDNLLPMADKAKFIETMESLSVSEGV